MTYLHNVDTPYHCYKLFQGFFYTLDFLNANTLSKLVWKKQREEGLLRTAELSKLL